MLHVYVMCNACKLVDLRNFFKAIILCPSGLHAIYPWSCTTRKCFVEIVYNAMSITVLFTAC